MLNRIKSLKNFFGNTFKVTRSGEEFLLRETDYGTVHVETDIIRRIVERVKIEGLHEIQSVSVEVPNEHAPLKISVEVVIAQNYPAPLLGANLRYTVNQTLRELLEIQDAIIEVRIAQINQNLPEKKKRRVR